MSDSKSKNMLSPGDKKDNSSSPNRRNSLSPSKDGGANQQDKIYLEDKRKKQFGIVSAILFILSIAIMLLSIMNNQDVGDEDLKSFKMSDAILDNIYDDSQDGEEGSKGDSSITYNSEGYYLVKQCNFHRYFT